MTGPENIALLLIQRMADVAEAARAVHRLRASGRFRRATMEAYRARFDSAVAAYTRQVLDLPAGISPEELADSLLGLNSNGLSNAAGPTALDTVRACDLPDLPAGTFPAGLFQPMKGSAIE